LFDLCDDGWWCGGDEIVEVSPHSHPFTVDDEQGKIVGRSSFERMLDVSGKSFDPILKRKHG